MLVKIKRHATDWEEDECNVELIKNVKWDRISGGVCAPEAHMSLYGYIDYTVAKELRIGISGRHDFGYNSAKVRISKPSKKSDKYYEGYEYLKRLAGPKPDSSFIRSECGKQIMSILEDVGLTRKELSQIMVDEGFEKDKVSKTISGLIEHNYIILINKKLTSYKNKES